jgi:D-glycero-D-manno-heptose 1,7-bisphosphate phosphatase
MNSNPGTLLQKAVFLDRDGVLSCSFVREGKPYAPTRFEDFRLLPDAATAAIAMKAAGFALVVVTNQPDVGNGKVGKAVVEQMNEALKRDLPIDIVKVCYHSQTEGCACRKPRPGMLLDAAADMNLDLAASYMVGDRWSDVAAGRAAGCQTVFIDRGYTEKRPDSADFQVASLAEAAEIITGGR